MIQTERLTKKFGELVAVDEISMSVRKGEVLGLLGPNGAGKTTLISMLCTILKPTFGTARVNGYDIIKHPDLVRKSIGIVFQDPSLDDRLTGKENLDMHARLYSVPKTLRERRINEVLELVELKERADDLVRTYSGGMRRRLEIARGLIHHPEVLFLDEPTLGLDPQTREHIWAYIKQLAKNESITIMLTTHYMDEADMLCDRIAIVDYGKIIALGTPSQLKKSVGEDTIILAFADRDMQRAKRAFPKSKEFDGQLALSVKNAEKDIAKAFEMARRNRIRISEAKIRKPSLEDVFLHLTGREIRDEKADSKFGMKLRHRLMSGGRRF